MTEKPIRIRSLAGAVSAWPHHMRAVEENPCGETLDRLCTLLDVIDAEVVRHWGDGSREARLTVLKAARVEARHANRLVTAALVTGAKERGVAAMAARKAKEAV